MPHLMFFFLFSGMYWVKLFRLRFLNGVYNAVPAGIVFLHLQFLSLQAQVCLASIYSQEPVRDESKSIHYLKMAADSGVSGLRDDSMIPEFILHYIHCALSHAANRV